VAVVVLAEVNEYRADEGNLSSRQLLVQVGGGTTAADDGTVEDGAAAVAAAAGGGEVLALDVAMNPAFASDAGVAEPIGVGTRIDRGFRNVDAGYVATPAVLAHLGVDPASIDPATELLTSVPGSLELVDFRARPTKGASTVVQRADLPRYSSGPRSLITERAMREHGWVATRAGWLVESATPLRPEQIDAARQAAARAGLTVETRSSQDELAALRTGSVVVGAVLALAIVAMAVGLLRGESVADLRTLAATGATPRTRRALTASTAGGLAVLGVLLSLAGAYAAVVAAYHGQLDRLLPVPLAHLLVLAVGLPAVAAAGGWLLAGREPPPANW
jgi:putative ABC transport system permease protein